MSEINKVSTLSDAPEFEVVEESTKEMELVDPSEFENKIASEVVESDLENIYAVSQEMVKFAHARNAIGLTFTQIGINKSGFVSLNNSGAWEVMLNPSYFGEGKKIWVYERSLSYGDDVYATQRFKRIRAVFYTIDVDKEDRLHLKKQYRMMSGMRAFSFQNLTDFVNGKTPKVTGIKYKGAPKDELQE